MSWLFSCPVLYSDLQYVSVEDMYSIQCSSSYALCRWWYLRELGLFAQMYEKMIQKHYVFLCIVRYKNWEWNWLGFSIDCWCSVKYCLYRPLQWLYLMEAQETGYFPARATIHLHCNTVLSCWWILHWKRWSKYINISEFSCTCCLSLSSPFYWNRFIYSSPQFSVVNLKSNHKFVTINRSTKSTQTRTSTSVVPLIIIIVIIAFIFTFTWKREWHKAVSFLFLSICLNSLTPPPLNSSFMRRRNEHLPEEWMTLLLFCITIMRAPTMPSFCSGAGGGACSTLSTCDMQHKRREPLNIHSIFDWITVSVRISDVEVWSINTSGFCSRTDSCEKY